MKDLTLKFPGNREFKSFLSSLDWEEDEDLQNKLLVDEIGFTYTETGVTEEGEPVCVRNDGYFVNIRILDDLFDGKRKLTAVCSHQTRIGNLDAHLI